jgi:predicted amidophosphoribosyltransferase
VTVASSSPSSSSEALTSAYGQPGAPAGFPNCALCPYVINGPVHVCTNCAAATLIPIAQNHCPICSQMLDATGVCSNGLCQGQRHIDRIRAVATYSGDLASSIKRFKYQGMWGWAAIFGRLVTGYLESNVSRGDVDLVIPNPTFRPDPNLIGHTEAVLQAAAKEDVLDRWPIVSYGILVKTAETPKSARGTWYEKQQAAEALYAALYLPNRDLIAGRRIVVYDDVCTSGQQLDAVARFLREHGAAAVEGLVLARTPWRS